MDYIYVLFYSSNFISYNFNMFFITAIRRIFDKFFIYIIKNIISTIFS